MQEEQKCKGAEVQETSWVLGITGGSLLQERTTGGKGGQNFILHFILGVGQATGNGNY